MVELNFKTDVSLDVFPKEKRAILRIQEQEISEYIFYSYLNYKEMATVRFFGNDNTNTATVKYDVLRIW